jgi:hypothetical protein
VKKKKGININDVIGVVGLLMIGFLIGLLSAAFIDAKETDRASNIYDDILAKTNRAYTDAQNALGWKLDAVSTMLDDENVLNQIKSQRTKLHKEMVFLEKIKDELEHPKVVIVNVPCGGK